MKTLESCLLVLLGALALQLGYACSIPPNVVQGGVATVETALCILNVASKDAQQHASPGQVVADCIQQCGTDAATVARVLDASNALALARADYDAGSR